MSDAKDPIKVRVQDKGGTYITNRVQGKQASCTAGPAQAVHALAEKLMPGQRFTVTQEDKEHFFIIPMQVITIVVALPCNVDMPLGCTVELQGKTVDCLTINWGTNTCLQASALEQRLETALTLLNDAGGLDEYNSMLQELADDGDLIELTNTTVDLYGTH